MELDDGWAEEIAECINNKVENRTREFYWTCNFVN